MYSYNEMEMKNVFIIEAKLVLKNPIVHLTSTGQLNI